jgi:predicted XRE-type DNA-binding protein
VNERTPHDGDELTDHIEYVDSTGNVFEDLGLPDAPELLAKARLAARISALIDERGLSQRAAAKVVGAEQPGISSITRGQLAGYTLDRLLRYLTALGQDVRIVVSPKPESAAVALLSVVSEPAPRP